MPDQKIGCIIQARMSSSRLPGKVMLNVEEQNPMIYHVLKQVFASKLCEQIVVATTILSEDDKIESFLKNMNVECFREDTNNVLD